MEWVAQTLKRKLIGSCRFSFILLSLEAQSLLQNAFFVCLVDFACLNSHKILNTK